MVRDDVGVLGGDGDNGWGGGGGGGGVDGGTTPLFRFEKRHYRVLETLALPGAEDAPVRRTAFERAATHKHAININRKKRKAPTGRPSACYVVSLGVRFDFAADPFFVCRLALGAGATFAQGPESVVLLLLRPYLPLSRAFMVVQIGKESKAFPLVRYLGGLTLLGLTVFFPALSRIIHSMSRTFGVLFPGCP